jgi:lipid II:glycine glycyltransferase (peptidoglycan interpeptide bridge formation enzyme)
VDDAGAVLMPLCLRPLATEPWVDSTEPWFDATTPYGYGGAFAWGAGRDVASDFWSALGAWAAASHVVSLFARLSLFSEQQLPFDPEGETDSPMQNIVRSLDLDSEATWYDYAHKVRKNVKRARSHGLTVEVDLKGANLDDFIDIYLHTMDRREASESFFFDRSFFERIIRKLAGGFAFFHLRDGEQIVSSELVLVSAHYVYSFLGGTRSEAFDKRPNDLLKHEVIEWARASGKKALVLGGGYGADDGIFKYKKSFAPSGVVPFRVGCRIYDYKVYEGLVARRRAYELERGQDWMPREGFFPAYRS